MYIFAKDLIELSKEEGVLGDELLCCAIEQGFLTWCCSPCGDILFGERKD